MRIHTSVMTIYTGERKTIADQIHDFLKTRPETHQADLVVDTQHNALQNNIRAWKKSHEHEVDWSAVAQDDIIFTTGFFEKLDFHLNNALALDFDVVSLYSNRAEDLMALGAGKDYRVCKGRDFLNEQYVLMTPRILGWYIQDLLDDVMEMPSKPWHDVMLASFFKRRGLDVYIALPNLVDHMEIKSTLGHPKATGGRKRVSRTFARNGL